MSRTAVFNNISDPWVFQDDNAGSIINGAETTSPIFKTKKTIMHSKHIQNPEEIDLEPVSIGHKTGM